MRRLPLFLDRTALPLLLAALSLPLAGGTAKADWPSWRGPRQDGVSTAQGLVSSWSPSGGKNVLWRADLSGRSTPVVYNGRVCANGRVGTGVTRQATVACFDAASGKKLWEQNLDIYLTAVPFSRVGWESLTADPETGYLYDLGVGGVLVCFDQDGQLVWWKSLTEEFGLISGVGGRTHTPILDENRLIVSFVNAGWGEQGVPRNRTFAFDKRTGAVLWAATPGEAPIDTNTQTTPVVAVIGGQRLIVEGEADGWVYALKARSGEMVWRFHLSKGAFNNTVAIDGDHVFATHGEENLDAGTQGRVVAIDGRGKGDVTKTHELWRNDEWPASFASPVYHDGILYVVDNSANLVAIDAANGQTLWHHKVGRIGKASPVWADGKLYVNEVNGRVSILKPSKTGVEVLDEEVIKIADGSRPAEMYGSPAIADGRVYLSTEAGLFCLGDKDAPARKDPPPPAGPKEEALEGDPPPTLLHVVPADLILKPGEVAEFHLESFDDRGHLLKAPLVKPTWTVGGGLKGKIEPYLEGTYLTVPAEQVFATGTVNVQLGELKASARVRVVPSFPWQENFDTLAAGQSPAGWVGAPTKYIGKETADGKVLAKPPVTRGLDRSNVAIGPPTLHDYTVQADLLGTQTGLVRPDMGLVASGYILDLMGNHQRLQLRAWDTELRLMEQVDYKWEPNRWYTMKLTVDTRGQEGLIRAKVWPRGEAEPEAWTVTAHDPRPVRHGSPGLYGYSASEIQYDNFKVTENP
ncbi:MAG TPA: PQQ-binding-like beta-propeller repeat protein [Thermoanaerobaculia bacterium]|nr:PQQ-binding-like beta-propeller repeat protein [Thermoanaerobaculia bacterium]